MSSRRIQSPGIEINEIDRSQYGKIDYSLPNAPTVLVTGFASKGEDLALQWINSQATLEETYGTPTNEFEQYFYNAAREVLNRGATCIAAKLPYDNESKDKFNYVDYDVSLSIGFAGTDLSGAFDTIREFHDTLAYVIDWLKEYKGEQRDFDIETIRKMAMTLQSIYETYIGDSGFTVNQSTTIEDMFVGLSSFIDRLAGVDDMFTLFANDSNLTSYLEIKTRLSAIQKPSLDGSNVEISAYGGVDSLENFDNYLVNCKKIDEGTIRIYDVTRAQYGKYEYGNEQFLSSTIDGSENDFLGIVPVIVTPANALFFQGLLDFTMSNANPRSFSQASQLTSIYNVSVDNSMLSVLPGYQVIPMDSVLSSTGFQDESPTRLQWIAQESISKQAAATFPLIGYDGKSHFQQDSLKKIGIVVFKAFKDVDNNGKIGLQLLESFVGSIDPTAKDPITGSKTFIDEVVNAQSNFIRVFSNVDQRKIETASTIVMRNQSAVSLGFYKVACKKTISYVNSLAKPLTTILDNAQNAYTLPLDLVVDAGVSNIAWIAKQFDKSGTIDAEAMPSIADYSRLKFDITSTDVTGWKMVLKKFDDFCKYTRKDCMFLADGIRAFCLDGNSKIVRKTAPQNTVVGTILPKLKYMSNTFDSSYSAGYCNWFYQQDYSSTDYIWIPPSIKALGVYIYCDTYFQPWSAPAGLRRGVISDVVDVAFVPNEDEAGKIYNAQWNYAMSYPMDGIVLEGHKTFQTQKTALDRVNVRRLMLYLEKSVARLARRFVYEGNTEYLRQQFVDTVRPIFEDAVHREGVKEYAIKCDDELNTVQVIENNELRCKIAVKPVKVVDFIVVDFIATRQSVSVNEEVIK